MANVTSSSPANKATEVYIGSPVVITFDFTRNIDPTSVTEATFAMYDQAWSIVKGAWTIDDVAHSITFTPTDSLKTRHKYTVTIRGANAGIRSIVDVWGNAEVLVENWSFYFTTNDGRFFTPPSEEDATASGSGIIYPDGVNYFTTYSVRSTNPVNGKINVDPSGLNLDASGLPTITLCFNKPVDITTLTQEDTCLTKPITIISKDVLEDPFSEDVDLTTSGTWSAVLWQAMFTFSSNNILGANREVTVTIPSTLRSEDGTYLTDGFVLEFMTKLDPYYIGVQHVRTTPVGKYIADIPDKTIALIIHSNSLKAYWYGTTTGYGTIIQPWTSQRYTGSEVTLSRTSFTVDAETGAPEYVKRYVLAQTWYDLLRAKYLGDVGDILSSGGPGASKSLDDLKISKGSGDIYAGTVGVILEQLEGNKKKGIKGEIQTWLDFITGRAKWTPALKVQWGLSDKTKPPKRTSFITGTSESSSTASSNPNA